MSTVKKYKLLKEISFPGIFCKAPDFFELVSDTVYTQSEVDTIRKEAFLDSRRGYRVLQDKDGYMVGDFIYPTVEGYLKTFEHLSSLNNSSESDYKNSWAGQQERLKEEKMNNDLADLAGLVIKGQPSNDNAFWTDELVKEFVRANFDREPHNYLPSAIKDFKQSKQPLNNSSEQPLITPIPDNTVDWEIAEYKNKNTGEIFEIASVWNNPYYKNGFKDRTGGFGEQQDVFDIHTVIRKSDNTVWTVVEMFSNNSANIYTEEQICAFKIEGNRMLVYQDKECANGFYDLDNISKLPSQPLPTDTDKPDTVNNDDVFCISVNDLKNRIPAMFDAWQDEIKKLQKLKLSH